MKFIKKLLRRFGIRPSDTFSSANYWDSRYNAGGNSGAGSYGQLASYKADVINQLVGELAINSMIEFGSGDGNQASMLDVPDYVGIDVSKNAVEIASARLQDDKHKKFHISDAFDVPKRGYDMAISLDVIYHLIEDEVFPKYMSDMCAASKKYVLIYA